MKSVPSLRSVLLTDAVRGDRRTPKGVPGMYDGHGCETAVKKKADVFTPF